MKKVIVVGMSAASVSFVVKLRSFDKDSEIICFSGEKDFAYNRCFLADFLTGEKTEQQLQLKPDDYFAQNNVAVHFNSWVTAIDTKAHSVTVGADQFYYDELFLGIGTKPFLPPFARDVKSSGLFTFHTLSDMHAISNYIQEKKVKTAIVIGGGLNGIEAVSSLLCLKISVTLIEAAKTILSGQVDSEIAQWVTAQAQSLGVSVLTSNRAEKICEENGAVCGVQLETETSQSGSIIFADMVIVAAGSQVNCELAKSAGISTEQGSIIVDQHMRTSVQNILAGGDVCRVPDMMTKKIMRSTTWSDAMLQGLCAATTLSATPRSYPGMVGLRDSYFFGKDFYACGNTTSDDTDVKTISKIDEKNIEKLYIKNDQLIGFVLIGDISKVSELKKLYTTQEKCF
ncbi:MAG: FAD-dependent oxidoreductase [Candidatus Dependentiae bacterium]|nr:FAD-dependent oxidoreductase [Candidatus Dependentiae bacterium]